MTHDQDDSQTYHNSSSLAGAVGTPYTHPEIHTCDFYRPCQFPGNHGGYCGLPVCCGSVLAHLRMHGIVDLSRSERVVCDWTGCEKEFLRHNTVRHIREKHLFHPRQ